MKPPVLFGYFLLLLAGCNSDSALETSTSSQAVEQPFLGVSEDRARTMEEENASVDFRLHGAATVTEVQTTDEATYQRFKKEGRIAQEEIRGGFVYFAVNEFRSTPLPQGGGGVASGAAFTVVSRYKAPIPQNQ